MLAHIAASLLLMVIVGFVSSVKTFSFVTSKFVPSFCCYFWLFSERFSLAIFSCKITVIYIVNYFYGLGGSA